MERRCCRCAAALVTATLFPVALAAGGDTDPVMINAAAGQHEIGGRIIPLVHTTFAAAEWQSGDFDLVIQSAQGPFVRGSSWISLQLANVPALGSDASAWRVEIEMQGSVSGLLDNSGDGVADQTVYLHLDIGDDDGSSLFGTGAATALAGAAVGTEAADTAAPFVSTIASVVSATTMVQSTDDPAMIGAFTPGAVAGNGLLRFLTPTTGGMSPPGQPPAPLYACAPVCPLNTFIYAVDSTGKKLGSSKPLTLHVDLLRVRLEFIEASALDCNDNGVLDGQDVSDGTAYDIDGDGVLDGCEPTCPTDTNASGMTDVDDLINVLLDWGTPGTVHNGDIDASGLVDGDDLIHLVTFWGEGC